MRIPQDKHQLMEGEQRKAVGRQFYKENTK